MPRVTHALRDTNAKTRARLRKTKPYLDSARNLASPAADRLGAVTARAGRKTVVYAGTGLALTGTAVAMVTGLTGTAATAAGQADEVSKTVTAAPAHQSATQPSAAASAKAGGETVRTTASRMAHHAPHAKTPQVRTWLAIERVVASHTTPHAGSGPLPAQDRLTPAGTTGPQSWLPMTQARYDNATAIVHQALHKKMGLRAAVIAVATAMQESTLLNIDHGDRDSLGLFQQRPSAGWGSAGQILRPAYAADAFLDALHSYQSSDPGWASQPLWQDAQNVQKSGFPYAYAKWEAQAAHLVTQITHRIY